MKRILFILSRFLDGGIDMVLVDYLRQLILCSEYEIGLAISIKMDELEVFTDSIPKQVKVYHLVENKKLTYWRKRKITTHLPVYAKIYDETVLAPIRRHLISKGLKTLANDYDVMIDFDCCHYAYLKAITIKKIAWYHFSFRHQMEHNSRRTLRIGKYLAYYDKIVVISKAMQEEGEQLFPWLKGKWKLIYNAKDKTLLEQNANEPVEDVRISEPYILSVERLEESQKDTTTLLHAYKILKEKYQVKEKLYLLGKGRDKQKLEQMTEELGIKNDVEFLGFFNNPYPWMRQARLIAHSAKMEGLPTALIESLILNKPIVATDCPTGPCEILDNGKAGMLVPVGDAQAMADAIYKMLTDRRIQHKILEHAREHHEQFLYKETLRQFKELI